MQAQQVFAELTLDVDQLQATVHPQHFFPAGGKLLVRRDTTTARRQHQLQIRGLQWPVDVGALIAVGRVSQYQTSALEHRLYLLVYLSIERSERRGDGLAQSMDCRMHFTHDDFVVDAIEDLDRRAGEQDIRRVIVAAEHLEAGDVQIGVPQGDETLDVRRAKLHLGMVLEVLQQLRPGCFQALIEEEARLKCRQQLREGVEQVEKINWLSVAWPRLMSKFLEQSSYTG